MLSVIYEYVDNKLQDFISIWSQEQFLATMKGKVCYQLVRCVELVHTDKDRDYFKWLSEDELWFALTQFMDKNQDKTLYPN